MAKDTISKNSFIDFLELLKLKGFVENKEILIESNTSYLTAHARTIDKTFGLKGIFYGNFEICEEVGIANLPQFIKYIELIKKDFKISYKKNKIIISGTKDKVATVMQKKDYIINKLEPSKFKKALDTFEKGVSFNLSAENCADIVKKFATIFPTTSVVTGNKTKTINNEVILKGKPKVMSLELKNTPEETELISEYDIDDIKDSFEITISKKFIDLLSCVKTDLKLSMVLPDPTALSVSIDNKDYKLDYLFALI